MKKRKRRKAAPFTYMDDTARRRRRIRRFFSAALAVVCIAVLLCAAINVAVIRLTRDRILTPDEAAACGADCILVLGAGLRPDGSPSLILSGRLELGVQVYEEGAAPKLVMSGDHGQENYNEVGTMKAFAVARGVPSEDVFMDHAGFSTYESLWRVKNVFGAQRVLIVSQTYHLYRALYIARTLGLEAWGVGASVDGIRGQPIREAREAAARVKDFFWCIAQPKPTYAGDPIPLSASGDVTND